MGLRDIFRKTELADDSPKLPQGGGAEVGVAGESIIAFLNNEEARTDDIPTWKYVLMRQKDGTIASLYSLLSLPILSAAKSFVPDENDKDGEQAEFIEQALTNPPHKGGMDLPLNLTLADMARALIEGFRVYERVYRINSDGQIVYKKLAPRNPAPKNDQSILLKRNATGDFDGFHQQVMYQGNWVDVEVPAWKSFLFTYNKDKNFLYGESAFKPAYYHYDLKHRLYQLANLAVQVGAVPPKIVKGSESVDNAARARVLREIDKLGVRSTAYLPDTYDLEPYKSSDGRIDPLPLIDHHDTQMARSVLAQFLMLGTSGSRSGGSHALSADQSSLFIQALKGVMSTIEDHINYYIIPDLIDLNFAEPAYPEFRFEDITTDNKALLTEAFVQMVTGGALTPAMTRAIEDRVADALDINREAAQQELDDETQEKIDKAKAAGIEVDQDGNPVPVVAPTVDPKTGQPVAPDATVPVSDGKPAGDIKADAPTPATDKAAKPTKMSDGEAGGSPKVSTTMSIYNTLR